MKRFVISLLVIAVLIWAISPVMAEEELQSPGLLPDHPFYGVKRWSEGVHMFFTFDDGAKARLHTRFSEARLAEAKAMTELGKPEWAGGLMEDYMDELNETFMCMQRQRQREGHIMDLAEHVCNATDKHAVILSDLVDKVPEQERPHIKRAINMTYKHVEVLEALLEKVPEPAKPHIEHAINVSIRGHETSVNRTQKGLQRTAEKYNRTGIGRIVREAGITARERGPG